MLATVQLSHLMVSGDVPYQLRVKVPIALHRLRRALPVEIPQRAGASHNPKHSDNGYPHIQETRCEVVSYRADRAPALAITA
jgi:hypothetical protein